MPTRRAVRQAIACVSALIITAAGVNGAARASSTLNSGSSTVTMSIAGHGSITVASETSSPPNCTSPGTNAQSSTYSCSTFDPGSSDTVCQSDGAGGSSCTLTVSAVAPAGWAFSGWSGDCTGASSTCTVATSDTSCDSSVKPPCFTQRYPSTFTASFTDVRAPTATIDSGPAQGSAVYSDSQQQQFTFHTDEDNEISSYRCALDSVPAGTCSSGFTWSNLADGVHQFCVRGLDASGMLGEAACRSWEQERLPTATIVTEPTSTTTTNDATFTYTSNKSDHVSDGSTLQFTCLLDGAHGPCPSSGMSYTHLLNGAHTFTVYANFHGTNDGPGEGQFGYQGYSWTQADTAAPTVSVTHAPAGVVISADTGQTVSWTGDQPDLDQTFTCRLDDASAGFTTCTSPLTLTNLHDGVHTLLIKGTNYLGNTGSPATIQWDQEIPAVTSITAGPASGSTVPSSSATFRFASPKSGVHFECRLDLGAYHACAGLGTDTLTRLRPGPHTESIRAKFTAPLDGSVHTGAAVSRTWTVLGRPVCTIALVSTKAVRGTVGARVRCSQPGSAAVGGTVTETIHNRNGTTSRKTVTLRSVRVSMATGVYRTVTLSLGAAWSDLLKRIPETLVLSISARNAAGSSSARTRPATLRH